MNLLIMGPAGAGKGTVSKKIAEKYGIPHISSGDMFRAEIGGNTELGRKAKEYMDQGKLVPDEVTIGMVSRRIHEPDCRKGYLLDGFPRTVAQAKALDELTQQAGMPIEGIIALELPYEVLLHRITGRRICPKCGAIYNVFTSPSKIDGICDRCGSVLKQRSDDTQEGLKKRLEEYENQTKPVLDYFADKGLIHPIDAEGKPAEVWQAVEKSLEGIK